MQREKNALDRMIEQFQHRWQTDAHFRAVWSGVLGVTMVLLLCSCMGIVSTVANSALAGAGFGNGSAANARVTTQGTPDTGVGALKANEQFPTPTSTVGNPGTPPPAVAIPNSQTPEATATAVPTATPAPTATACQTNCGGDNGGGNGGSNGNLSVTITPQPQPWKANTPASLIIVANQPSAQVTAITIDFPGAGPTPETPQAGAPGAYAASFNVPGNTTAGPATIQVTVSYNGSTQSFTQTAQCTAAGG